MRIPKKLVNRDKLEPTYEMESDVKLETIGRVNWDQVEIRSKLEEFLPIFAQRPIQDNQGGMTSVGLFNVWFLLNKLQPQYVIESGIWKGQSTWLIENTLTQARILSIDIDLSLRNFISSRAIYSQEDFLAINIAKLGWRFENSLAFFDDHQHVIPRLQKCLALGIKDIILDDDYPEYAGARHLSAASSWNEKDPSGKPRFPNEKHFLEQHLEAYYLMPPLFDYPEALTQEKSYLTMNSLMGKYDPLRHGKLAIYNRDMYSYRWTTYLRLK